MSGGEGGYGFSEQCYGDVLEHPRVSMGAYARVRLRDRV